MPRSGPHQRRLKYLKERFAAYGLRPNRKLGQNFLLDRNAVEAICRDAQIYPLDVVLEVGPGSGLLTTALARTGAAVLAVELDRGLAELVRGEVGDTPNVEVMEADILQDKTTIEPTVTARLQTLYEGRERHGLKCVSNLPYCIASPFVANLCGSDLPWDCGVFMVQREEAERFAAAPGTPQYGTLSVVVGLATRKVKILRAMPPAVFWPRPRVQSCVVLLEFLPRAARGAVPWTWVRRVNAALFHARRKKITNALRPLCGGDRHAPRTLCEGLGIDPDIRGEKLSPAVIRRLAERVAQAGEAE